jgi:hypothetical protein
MREDLKLLRTSFSMAAAMALATGLALVTTVPAAAAVSIVGTQDYTIGPGAVLHATAVAQPDTAGATANYTVGFTTPLTLFGGSSTITLSAPPGSVKFPSANNAYVLIDNTNASGDQVFSSVSVSPGGESATLTLSASVAAGSSLAVLVIGATNPANPGSYSIDIATSANPEPASTANFEIVAAASPPSFSPVATPALVGGLSTYTVGTFEAASNLSAGDEVAVSSYVGPGAVDNIGFPTSTSSYKIEDLTTSVELVPEAVAVSAVGSGETGETVALVLPSAIAAGDELSVTINGVRNPTTTQVDTITAAAPSTATPSQATLRIGTSVTEPSFTLSETGAGASGVGYSVGFKLTTDLPQGGTVTLVAPSGTSFSGASVTLVDLTHLSASAAIPPSSLTVSASSGSSTANVLTVTVPHLLFAGDSVSLDVSGVVNPPAGSYGGQAGDFTVSTSSDVIPVNLPAYTITPAPAPVLASIELSSSAPGAIAQYTIGDLEATAYFPVGAQVSLSAPAGTLLPGAPGAYTVDDLTHPSGSAQAISVTGGGTNQVSLETGASIAQGDFLEIVVSGVVNPPAGTYHMTIVGNLEAAVPPSAPPPPPPLVPKATSTALFASANPVQVGLPVTYTARVSPAPNGGRVIFTNGGVPVAGCTSQPVVNGAATCTTAYWKAGLVAAQAVYTGNSGFKRSASAYLTESITWPPVGYWLLARTGAVFGLGGARSFGGATPNAATGPVVGIAGTPSGRGYWVVTSNGTVFAFGDAHYYGDLPALGVHARDVTAIAPTYNGQGYWLIGRDGGMFTFGNARFHGSVPGLGLHVHDIVGMVASPGGGGYLLVGADGGVFTFGSAHFYGSLPGIGKHVHDIRAILPSSTGRGYVLVGADGGAFVFGSGVRFYGSLPGEGIHVHDIVGIALTPDNRGYFMAAADGAVYGFGNAHPFPMPAQLPANLPVVQIAGT